jgi:hypothetical protein
MSRIGLIALIAANLFVVLQTLRHEWGYYETILVFWGEVVILGGYNVLRLTVVGVVGAAPLGTWLAQWVNLGSRWNRFIYTAIGIGFFVIKFSGFALSIGLFALLLPAMLQPEAEGSGRTIHEALGAVGPGLMASVGALCLSHGVSFVRNFLVGREYDRLNIAGLVFWPYARMSLVAGVLLAGLAIARRFPALGEQTAFAVVMVLLKLGADSVSHALEHGWLTPEAPDRSLTTSRTSSTLAPALVAEGDRKT